MAKPSKFKIYYIHQVPGDAYERDVPSAEVGLQILDAIYDVALYQFDSGMIPDYANAGGVMYWDTDDDTWYDYDPEDWEYE